MKYFYLPIYLLIYTRINNKTPKKMVEKTIKCYILYVIFYEKPINKNLIP